MSFIYLFVVTVFVCKVLRIFPSHYRSGVLPLIQHLLHRCQFKITVSLELVDLAETEGASDSTERDSEVQGILEVLTHGQKSKTVWPPSMRIVDQDGL